MPQTDEEFVDFVFHTISHDLKRLGDFSNGVLDSIDKQFNSAAHSVREVLNASPWIPEQIRPPPPPPPRSSMQAYHANVLERASGWLHRNRAFAAAIIAFVGTGTFLIWRQRRWRRQKRRARRASNGAKTEVVILAGSPYSLLTQSLAMDLERRGFLVFIPVSSIEEETAIAALRLTDVRALNFDITSPQSSEHMLENFSAYLANPQRHGISQLHLASLIIAEADASAQPTRPIKSIPASLWLDTINAHLIYPISIIHTFLPLLTDTPHRTEQPKCRDSVDSTVVIITQSNTSSLELPDHACESLSSAALSSFTRTLQAELPPICGVVHVRLGAIDFDGVRRSGKIPSPTLIRSGRDAPGQSFPSMHLARQTRELHLAVFDAMTGKAQGTVFVGPGARTYALMGALAPRNLILWMVGQRSVTDTFRKETPSFAIRTGRNEGNTSGSETGRSIEWENISSS